MKIDLCRLHITQAMLAGQYELDGDLRAANQLRAFCKLRICTQGSDFLFSLATALATPQTSRGTLFAQICAEREKMIETKSEWVRWICKETMRELTRPEPRKG